MKVHLKDQNMFFFIATSPALWNKELFQAKCGVWLDKSDQKPRMTFDESEVTCKNCLKKID